MLLFKKFVWLITFLAFFSLAEAKTFNKGDTIMVAYPAANIKDDAYIIGLVRKRLSNGDYQISVLDYVKGHDYGLSCVPIAEDEFGQAKEVAWEMWSDKTKLFGKGMQYQVKQKDVRKLQTGQFWFIDRNNLYVSYSRWRSNSPIMPIEKFDMMIKKAQSHGLSAMLPALKLAKMERQSYYDSQVGRPFWPYETIEGLDKVLKQVSLLLAEDAKLNQLWRASKRDWDTINASTEHFFLVDAFDKIVLDAAYQVTEEGMEKADPKKVTSVKQSLTNLGVKY